MTSLTYSKCVPAGGPQFAGPATGLTFLIPPGFKVDDPPPPKFLIFFDDIPDSINAACVLRRRLPSELREKIRSGETWGLCTTTSFGMVCTTGYLDGDPVESFM